MAEQVESSGRLPRDRAMRMTVGDVMIANPQTLPADALVADVRRMFDRPSQRTVLLAEGGIFRGAIERDGLPAGASEDEPAARYADTAVPTATPGMSMTEAVALLDDRPEPRLIVLDEDGMTLRGLLCFSRGSSEFCVA
jgi:CBS domain-containing protein